ncbi:stalk domain-containing protein [Paenibacillus sp. S-38]|uniref:stalk domain-containing protein n=1 Tax=Paenibacillus sp. S-38 TaxID=3416710 RepID=UPI003CE85BE9
MKKVLLSALIIGSTLITATSISYSSNYLENVFLFPVKLLFNDTLKDLDKGYSTLNYNGHTYLPARFLVENMGGTIEYDPLEKTVSVLTADSSSEKISTLSSVKKEMDYELVLHSANSMYSEKKHLNIWGNLVYKGKQSKEITHASSVLVFYIRDEDGFETGVYRSAVGKKSLLNKNSEITYELPPALIREYNFQKNNGNGREEYENSSIFLKPGKYTIGINASFNDGTEKKLNTELQINIQ